MRRTQSEEQDVQQFTSPVRFQDASVSRYNHVGASAQPHLYVGAFASGRTPAKPEHRTRVAPAARNENAGARFAGYLIKASICPHALRRRLIPRDGRMHVREGAWAWT